MIISEEIEKKAEKLVDTWTSRYRRGSLRFFVIHILQHHIAHSAKTPSRSPCYGYKMAKEIEKATDGKWDLPPASIYPILKELVSLGIIEKVTTSEEWIDDNQRPVKQYELTEYGHVVAGKLQTAREEFSKAFFLKNIENLDLETLENLKSRHERMCRHHQKVLNQIQQSIEKIKR